MKRYSILTYNFGGYEVLHEVVNPQEDVEYVYVTDDLTLKSNTWKIVYVDFPDTMNNFDKVCEVRYNCFKYCTTDICIRIDASIKVIGSTDKLIEDFNKGGYDFGVCVHPARYNFVDEYNAWLAYRGYDLDQARKCVSMFMNAKYDMEYKSMIQQNISIQRRGELNDNIDRMSYALVRFIGVDGHAERIDQIITSFVLNRYFNTCKVLTMSEQVVHSNVFQWCLHGTDIYQFKENVKPSYPFYDNGYFFNKEVELYKIK